MAEDLPLAETKESTVVPASLAWAVRRVSSSAVPVTVATVTEVVEAVVGVAILFPIVS